MNIKKTLLNILIYSSTVAISSAVVSLNPATFTNANVGAGTLGFLVVDTAGDGFGDVVGGTYSKSTLDTDTYFIDGSDDRIIAIGEFAVGGGFDTTTRLSFISNNEIRTGTDTPTGPFTLGTEFAFYWFPDLELTDTAFTAGDNYGIARYDGTDANSTSVNGTEFILIDGVDSFDVEVTGDSALANFTVIPEPSSTALLGLGGLALLARRRRA